MPGPRLRVFAGPNGSGKSTLKRILDPELIYIYVNADDLEREAKDGGAIDLAPFAINPTQEVFRDFFASHSLIAREQLASQAEHFHHCRSGVSNQWYRGAVLPCLGHRRLHQTPVA